MAHQHQEQLYPPELASGLEEIEAFRIRRAEIALAAARYIVNSLGGETTDMGLYYAAMFGRTRTEGGAEKETNYEGLHDIRTQFYHPPAEGLPIIVHAINYPEDNAEVGAVGSFSPETFEPVRFKIRMEQDDEHLRAWRGWMSIAMRKVEPVGTATEPDYKLADEPTFAGVCETLTMIRDGQSLEIRPAGTNHVEVGIHATRNSELGRKFWDGPAYWLRQHLAPTEILPWTPDRENSRFIHQQVTAQIMDETGMTEAEATAKGLSPSYENLFRELAPYIGREEPAAIDVKALLKASHDAYDAQELLLGLEIDGVVCRDEEGALFVSPLGQEAFAYLD